MGVRSLGFDALGRGGGRTRKGLYDRGRRIACCVDRWQRWRGWRLGGQRGLERHDSVWLDRCRFGNEGVEGRANRRGVVVGCVVAEPRAVRFRRRPQRTMDGRRFVAVRPCALRCHDEAVPEFDQRPAYQALKMDACRSLGFLRVAPRPLCVERCESARHRCVCARPTSNVSGRDGRRLAIAHREEATLSWSPAQSPRVRRSHPRAIVAWCERGRYRARRWPS